MKIILGEGFISGGSLIYKVWHSNHRKTTRQFGVRSKLFISIVWHYSVLLFWFHCCSLKKINMFNFQKNMFLIYTWDYCPYFQSRRGGGGGVKNFVTKQRGGILLKLRIVTRGNEGPNFRQKKQCYVTLEWSLLKKCFLFKRFLKFKIIDYLPNYQNFCGKSLKFLTQLSLLNILACMFIESWQGRCKQAMTLLNCKE